MSYTIEIAITVVNDSRLILCNCPGFLQAQYYTATILPICIFFVKNQEVEPFDS